MEVCGGAFAGAVVFVLLAQKLVTEEDFHFIVFYVAILFLALYLAVIAMYRRGPRWHSWALLAALVVVCVESAVNMAVTSVPVTSRTDYVEDNEAVKKLVDSGLVQIKKKDKFSYYYVNLGMLMQYLNATKKFAVQ